ncbi:DNA-binding PadR family transcriptional regulator [Agrococcus jenensis]|uniref:DNA-binding PadR family transcriptional regulator n=1 Tax=Agrococcus jenensis TaxID=46353 RepID=A0A3N2ASS6_9MICO|nr:DNA-binding PadR family transcriptional regulator [Agrococcus jenensis]
MSPVFGHGALRLYLLSLLAEAPRHGYELMQALSDRFGGTYSPSAGTIYPRLSKLEEEGLLTKSTDGRKTTYEITDAGRAELAAREGELRELEGEITDSVRRMASDVRAGVKSAMQALRADLAAAERDARGTPPTPSTPTPPEREERGWFEAHTPPASAPDPSARERRSSPSSSVPNPASAPWPEAEPSWPEHSWPASSPAAPSWTEAGTSADAAHPAERAAARMAVHDIDLALTEFRQQVREAARADRGERVSTAKAASVRVELEAALLRIKSVLGS